MAALRGLLAEKVNEDDTELVFKRTEENHLSVSAPGVLGNKIHECNILDELIVGNDRITLTGYSTRGGYVSVHLSLTAEAAQLLSEAIRRERLLFMYLNEESTEARSILREKWLSGRS